VTTALQTFPALWYTSGTVINTGQRSCAFERWAGYHAGRHGTGWRKRSTAIPLATGAAVHKGVELIGTWLLDWQAVSTARQPSALINTPILDEVVAWAALEAAAGYSRGARERGLELTKTDVAAAEAVEQLIVEQATLIEAQVWVYALVRLPYMLSEYRVIAVEFEERPVVDCTCGLGDWVGLSETHAARQCAGIVLQGRADFLWQHVATGKIVYEEFKTKAMANYGWEMSWEHSGQLLLNMEAASRRLGTDVSEAFVPILFKGKRDRINRDDPTSPRIQQSPLVYGWYDPGNGMGREPDWSARYKWYDDWGKGHTLPRTYQRTGIWIDDLPLPTANPNGVTVRAGASRVEQWVRGWILPGQYPELLKVIGPFPKPRARVPAAIQSLLAEERRWRSDVADLRRMGLFDVTDSHTFSEDGQLPVTYDVADFIPRSWNCTHFDGSPCQFKPICHGESGSERGLAGMDELYEIRTPHHTTEKEALTAQITSLGLQWREEDEDDPGE
jgi:hypothetical protein